MRVGFVTQLLWNRYGSFWHKTLSGLGHDILFPSEEQTAKLLGDERLSAVSGLAFKIATAQALSLGDADVLIVPDLNPNTEIPRGGGQDPWIANFPEVLATTVPGLPRIVGVPAYLDMGLESFILETLHSFGTDNITTKRVWERNRSSLKPMRYTEPRWQLRPSEKDSVGLVAQPWLLNDDVLALFQADDTYMISQHQLNPHNLRAEGSRADDRLVPTDSEVLGAARFMGRKGVLKRLHVVVDESSGSDAWLLKRIQTLTHKPVEVVSIQEQWTPEQAFQMLFVSP